MTLLAFHDDPKIKETYLSRVEAHAKADELIKGKYWENGRGCAVGCTIHSGLHAAYETELGIPQMLAYIEDRIFEGSNNGWSKAWPERFLKAIKPGADVSKVGWKFQHWILLDPKEGCVRFARPQDKAIFEQIGSLLLDLTMGRQISQSAAQSAAAWSAESAAQSAAAWSAESAARSAAAWSAESAARSAAAWSAESAAWSAAAWSAESAAWSAESAAWSAESAAQSAAWSARSAAAWSAESAASAARSAESAAYERQGEKLLELLAEAPCSR